MENLRSPCCWIGISSVNVTRVRDFLCQIELPWITRVYHEIFEALINASLILVAFCWGRTHPNQQHKVKNRHKRYKIDMSYEVSLPNATVQAVAGLAYRFAEHFANAWWISGAHVDLWVTAWRALKHTVKIDPELGVFWVIWSTNVVSVRRLTFSSQVMLPGPRKTENLMGRRQKNLTNFLVSDLALYKDITAGNHSFNNQIWGFPAKFNLQSILDVYFLMIFRAWIKFRYLQYPQIGLTPRAKKSSHG